MAVPQKADKCSSITKYRYTDRFKRQLVEVRSSLYKLTYQNFKLLKKKRITYNRYYFIKSLILNKNFNFISLRFFNLYNFYSIVVNVSNEGTI